MARRIRITSATSVSDGTGHRYGHGQVVEVDDDLAAAWVAAGHAEPDGGKPTSKSRGRGADKPVRQAADGRRRATRRAPRTAAAKAAGASDAEPVSDDQEQGSSPADDDSPGSGE